MKMKISIITVTYNSEKTIRQTLESVCNQTYPNIDYVVIDGGSTDGTTKIIKEYEDKISYWISEPDKGIYNAFNKGINNSVGDYIYFLGSDDSLIDENIISVVAEKLNPSVDMLSGAVYRVDEETKLQLYRGNEFARDRKCYKGGMVPHQGLFVKRDLMKKYMFDEVYKISADYKFFLQCYYHEGVNVMFIDEPIAYYASTGVSSTDNEALGKEVRKIYDELNISFKPLAKEPFIKSFIKTILVKVGLFFYLKKFINVNFRNWQIHKCDNKYCRWCKNIN